MSISAITVGDQQCAAVVPWINQNYWIRENGSAHCILEVVVECLSGELEELLLFFPYIAEGLSDGCADLIDDRNRRFYDSYAIIERDPDEGILGGIDLDSIETRVGTIDLTSTRVAIGSVVRVRFLKPVAPLEKRAFRIRFHCSRVSVQKPDGSFGCFLEYYTSKAASLLNLAPEKTPAVRKLMIWTGFPVGTDSVHGSTPEFQRKTYTKSIMPEAVVQYGPGFEQARAEGPHRHFVFWKRESVGEKPALEAWTSAYFYCDYRLAPREASTVLRESSDDRLYAVYMTDGKSPGVSRSREIATSELEHELPRFLRCTDLVLDDRYRDLYVNGNKVGDSRAEASPARAMGRAEIKLSATRYNLLKYLLRNKDRVLTADQIHDAAWSHVTDSVDNLPDSYQAMVKNEISAVRKAFSSLGLSKKLEIASIRRLGYKLAGNCSICLILPKDKTANEKP